MGKYKKKIKTKKLEGIKLIPSKEEIERDCNQIRSMDHKVMSNYTLNKLLDE
jgi:hypothetical protein